MKDITIDDSLLESFKAFTKISHDSEDTYLKELLKRAYSNLMSRFGEFDIDTNLEGQALVFARARYAYEDLLEYFNDNYQDDLIHFGLNNAIGSGTSEDPI